MDGSVPNLRLQIAALLDGTTDLYRFQLWVGRAEGAIELHGTDEEIDLLNRVINILAEYTGNHIDSSQVLHELRAETREREAEFGVVPERVTA